LLSLFSVAIISRLFIQQKELDTTSYPENLFEERELSDASDIDVSGDQDYLLEEKKCNKVRSYSRLFAVSLFFNARKRKSERNEFEHPIESPVLRCRPVLAQFYPLVQRSNKNKRKIEGCEQS